MVNKAEALFWQASEGTRQVLMMKIHITDIIYIYAYKYVYMYIYIYVFFLVYTYLHM
jgi:hypothetical protein